MFLGRQKEIQDLKSIISTGGCGIAVIYGRRRVGKSALIQEAFKDQQTLYFEGLENQSKNAQIANFIFLLRQQIGIDLPTKLPKTWRETFALMLPKLKEQPFVLVLDEFQWMGNYRSEIVSELKLVWEQFFKKTKLQALIICGSVASFMVKKVIHSKAIYGRTNLVINLQPFQFSETKQFLVGKSLQDQLQTQLIFGGIPQYLSLVSPFSSTRDAVTNSCFSPNAYFVQEFDRIFVSHFGRNTHYEKIIRVLADHPYGLDRKEVSTFVKLKLGGQLSEELFNLESSGFIKSFTPFDKTESSRFQRYKLTDPFLNFYCCFIRPNLRQIQAGQSGIFDRLYHSARFQSYLGHLFELFCMEHAVRISDILGFSGIDYRFGPYFRARKNDVKGIQVDLIFDRSDGVILCCEMKYSTDSLSAQKIIDSMNKKVAILRQMSSKTILPILVTNTQDVSSILKNYFYKIISVKEFS